uniref:Carboxypeptidase n=2 Tax=Physcomitrium patens TaxID=3218 RepID=A0A2K1KGJ1_PHYPA|nr:hypothetical protein PHYPA_009254 [Physcomitrium patens]
MYLRLRTIGGLCIGESGRKFFPASQSPGVAPNTRNVAGNCNCRPRHGNQRRISLEIAPKSQPRTPVASPIAASNVDADFPNEATPSMSGYLPISSDSKSRLFYVFYEATHNSRRVSETPVMLWLNGGPGCSSMIGCFYELGPWRVNEKLKLSRNEGAWNRRCGLLFIDQPIGVGFSIAAHVSEIPSDEHTVADHLFYALQFWCQSNPGFQKRPIFVAGESYAGKYVPALAYYMLTRNQEEHAFAQFAGMAIGNGLVDPIIQIAQAADTAFYFGLIDEAQCITVRAMARDLVELIDKAQWLEATLKNLELVMYIYKASGIATMLDIRRTSRYHHREDGIEFMAPFLNSSSTKAALKIEKGSSPWSSSRPTVKKAMAPDVMKSTKWMVEAVLKAGYPVLLYQGVYDVKDGPACNEAWMRAIVWDHIKGFWASEREIWRVGRKLAGYWRRWKNLSHVVVQGAGHQVPYDQPIFAQDMIERWIAISLHPGTNMNLSEDAEDQVVRSEEHKNSSVNPLVQGDVPDSAL